MRISDWSSDVCSSDLLSLCARARGTPPPRRSRQVADDANTAGAMYPDQSLYPADAGPALCRRINNTLQRADQIEHQEGTLTRDWFAPIVADAEAGFGGPLNCFEIMKAYIAAEIGRAHV